MTEQNAAQPIELDLQQLLGFRDLTALNEDAGIVEEELDAAHVKIGELPPAP